MSRLIDLGCKAADVHHRYHEIHAAMFGAASFRLIIDALRGRRRHMYRKYVQVLKGLRDELAEFIPDVADFAVQDAAKATEREVRRALLQYLHALDQAIANLLVIFENLEQDESAYRSTGDDGRSAFTNDKLHYDHSLSDLERLGTRLNRLFAKY